MGPAAGYGATREGGVWSAMGDWILHVDAGYNIVGMKHPEAPDIDITVPKT